MKKMISFSQYFIHILIIVCGIIGVIGGLLSSLEFPSEANICLLFLVIIGLFIYYLYYQKSKKVGIYVVITEIMLAIYLFVLRSLDINNLINQLNYIIKYDYYLKVDGLLSNSSISDSLFLFAFVVFIGLPFVYLIVSVVMNKRFVIIKLIVLLIMFIFPIAIKHPLSNVAGYIFAIFLVYSFVFSFLVHKQSVQITHQAIVLTIIVITLMFSSVFLESNPIFKSNSFDVLFNISSWVEENQWNQWFNTQNSTGASASINGALPNGNVTIDGRIALKVKSDKAFSSYLRSYSLGYYTNNRWQPVVNEYEGDSNKSLLNYSLNQDIFAEYTATVKIEMERKTKYQIVPYYPIMNESLVDDSYYKAIDEPIRVDFTKNIQYFDGYNGYDDSQYYNYVLKEYMNVPDNLKAKFKQLVEKEKITHGKDLEYSSFVEKLAYVTNLLNEYTNYSLDSGNLPAGKDFVEYFLFENQKGSCTHYASAATLLLRYLDIPSRYVTGFVMTSSDFDKNNEAIIRNNRAHAWVEVYQEGVGWIPVDFTKSINSETTETGMASQLDALLQNQTTGEEAPVVPETRQKDPLSLNRFEEEVSETDTDVEENVTSWYDVIVQYSQYLYVIGGGLFVFIIYRYSQKTLILYKIKKAKNNQKVILIYQRMLKIDKDKAYINDDVVDMAYKAKFSQHFIDDNEIEKMNAELKAVQDYVYRSLPWYKKVLYKYILGYM
ncbi:MAG: transglutaminase domain-containing protein [Coprobacillus sp.]